MNYGIYNELVPDASGTPKMMTIITDNIVKENWSDTYVVPLINLFRDYIEIESLQKSMIQFVFNAEDEVAINLEDALINLCLWGFVVNFDRKVQPYHIFFEDTITSSNVENYINEFCILPHRQDDNGMSFAKFNDTIYRTYRMLTFVDDFDMFLNNNLNLIDFLDMMNNCQEFDDLLHMDYSCYSPEKINQEAMKNTYKFQDLMLDSKKYIGREVGIIDLFRAKTGLSTKQLKEFTINIGTKPSGSGGVFPYPLNTSYLVHGLDRFEYMLGDSCAGRSAQIITKKNTADSGTMARSLDLNNIESFLYYNPRTLEIDPEYDCHTQNYVKVGIKNFHRLKILADRYFRFDPNGMEYNIGPLLALKEDNPLIGKTIYLRSPITCKSAADGHGICRKCYGELFKTVMNFNVGKTASEIISAIITQIMLSAKHVNESKIIQTTWVTSTGDKINFLHIDEGTVYLNSKCNIQSYSLKIDLDEIHLMQIFTSEDEDFDKDVEDMFGNQYYITKFDVISPTGEIITVNTSNFDNLTLSSELYDLVGKYTDDEEEMAIIPMSELQDVALFYIELLNDDMVNKLKTILKTIDLKAITEKFDIDSFYEALISNMEMIGSGIDNIMSIHPEIIIMNQIRDGNDMLEFPDWSVPNQTNYRILTLKKSIEYHPSIATSIQFDNLGKTFKNPMSFMKNRPSSSDLFYLVKPLEYLMTDPDKLPDGISPFIKIKDEV